MQFRILPGAKATVGFMRMPIGFDWQEAGSFTAKDAPEIQRIDGQSNFGVMFSYERPARGRPEPDAEYDRAAGHHGADRAGVRAGHVRPASLLPDQVAARIGQHQAFPVAARADLRPQARYGVPERGRGRPFCVARRQGAHRAGPRQPRVGRSGDRGIHLASMPRVSFECFALSSFLTSVVAVAREPAARTGLRARTRSRCWIALHGDGRFVQYGPARAVLSWIDGRS